MLVPTWQRGDQDSFGWLFFWASRRKVQEKSLWPGRSAKRLKCRTSASVAETTRGRSGLSGSQMSAMTTVTGTGWQPVAPHGAKVNDNTEAGDKMETKTKKKRYHPKWKRQVGVWTPTWGALLNVWELLATGFFCRNCRPLGLREVLRGNPLGEKSNQSFP